MCLFTDSLAPSGVGEHMLTLADGLCADYTLSLVCPPSPSGEKLLARAAEMGLTTLPLEVRGGAEASTQLVDWLQQQQVRLFHNHAGVAWEGHDGVRAARAANVPSVIRTEHLPDLTAVFAVDELPDLVYGPYHRPERRLGLAQLTDMVAANRAEYRELIELVDRLICVSEAVRDSFLPSGIPENKTRVVRNGIAPKPSASDRPGARERTGIASDARVVLTIGRLIDVKGHDHLIDAVPLVVAQEPDTRFVWVGGGPLEQELRERVAALGMDGWVQFAGHRNDVPDLLAAADLFVLPSLVEGLPLVVLEAMTAGLPVVGTRVPGTSEIIVDGVTGRLVERGRLAGKGDPEALAAAILEPLQDRELAARWGAAGRRRVAAEFSAHRMARETAAVYEELLA